MCDSLKLHQLHLPQSIHIGECWARDGLQNESLIVPTEEKVEMITRMVDAGFTKIEATSFAHPKYLPQFADAEEVLRRIPRREGLEYRAICATKMAVARAIASKGEGFGVDVLAMIISSTEEYNTTNVGMDRATNKKLIEEMVVTAKESGHKIFGWVLTAFGCPIKGDVPLDEVAEMAKWWDGLGADYIGFGDTTGSSNPMQVSRFFDYMLAEGLDKDKLVAHFHDTRGWGIANSLTALTYGLTHFDTSFGAIGGQARTGTAEYHHGASGNTCTEDLVGMFEEMGVSTGIDQLMMIDIGRRAEQILGRKLRSNYIDAGQVPHEGVKYDKEKGILD